jgi:hypothetical protein
MALACGGAGLVWGGRPSCGLGAWAGPTSRRSAGDSDVLCVIKALVAGVYEARLADLGCHPTLVSPPRMDCLGLVGMVTPVILFLFLSAGYALQMGGMCHVEWNGTVAVRATHVCRRLCIPPATQPHSTAPCIHPVAHFASPGRQRTPAPPAPAPPALPPQDPNYPHLALYPSPPSVQSLAPATASHCRRHRLNPHSS